jgi:hypothetical protein
MFLGCCQDKYGMFGSSNVFRKALKAAEDNI